MAKKLDAKTERAVRAEALALEAEAEAAEAYPAGTQITWRTGPAACSTSEPVGERLKRPVDLASGVGRDGHRPSGAGAGCRWCAAPAAES